MPRLGASRALVTRSATRSRSGRSDRHRRGDDAAIDAIRQHYPQARSLSIHAGDEIDRMARALEAASDGTVIDHLFSIAPQQGKASLDIGTLVNDQDHGVIHLFRTIKALLQLGYGNRALGLSIISYRTVAVHHRDVGRPYSCRPARTGRLPRQGVPRVEDPFYRPGRPPGTQPGLPIRCSSSA